MKREEITHAVKRLIDTAAMEQEWSIAELTRRLRKGASTLHRWRNGQTVSFEMPTLLQICEYAGMTLDEAFGLMPSPDSQYAAGTAASLEKRVAAQEVELRKIQGLIQAANSMLNTIDQSIDTSLGATKVPKELAAVKKTNDRLKKLQQKRGREEKLEAQQSKRKQG